MPRRGSFISRGARIRSISRASRTAFLPVRRGLPGGLCLPIRDYIDKIHKKFPVKFT